MFSGRLPFGRNFVNPDAPGAAAAAQARAIYGERDVRFNDDGRPLVPGADRQQPGNMLLWRRGVEEAPPPEDNWRYRPWNRTSEPVFPVRAPIITRRFDAQELPYVTNGVATERLVKTTMRPETIVVEEMKVYDERPCAWWLFIIVGILMLVLGVLNVIWCWWPHYYCRFWTGIFIILTGIFGAIHRGDYLTKWKSWIYIVVGFIATILIKASCYLVLLTLVHQFIEMWQWTPNVYALKLIERQNLVGNSPAANLTADWKSNVWVCVSLDSVDIVLLLISFGILSSVLKVIDRYFNSYYVIRKKVEPFCHPWLFNPWGQCTLGQIQIFIGFVLYAIPYGTRFYPYQNTFAGVWSGIIPIPAGIAAALCLKGCNNKRRLLNIIALVLEVISIIASIVAIILLTLGIIDNIRTLVEGNVMLVTDFPKQMMVVSSVSFALSNITCIVNVFYSLSLLIRILYCICTNCCGKDLTKNDKEVVVEETKYLGEDDKLDDNAVYKDKVSDTRTEPYPFSRPFVRRSDVAGFDPYRPAGSRSYFVR